MHRVVQEFRSIQGHVEKNEVGERRQDEYFARQTDFSRCLCGFLIMFEVYHYPFSPSSRFVRLIVGEYGLDARFRVEAFWESERELSIVDSAGFVPVLCEEGGPTIFGAVPFMEYICETRGYTANEHQLMPDHSPGSRAEVRSLVEWLLIRCEFDGLSLLVYEKVLKSEMPGLSDREPDSSVLRSARASLQRHIKNTAMLVSVRDWVAGTKDMSFADLAAASMLSVLDYLGEVDWEKVEALKRWYQKMKSRPSFRTLLMDRTLSLPPSATYVDLDF